MLFIKSKFNRRTDRLDKSKKKEFLLSRSSTEYKVEILYDSDINWSPFNRIEKKKIRSTNVERRKQKKKNANPSPKEKYNLNWNNSFSLFSNFYNSFAFWERPLKKKKKKKNHFRNFDSEFRFPRELCF